jgi:hypothetical protein
VSSPSDSGHVHGDSFSARKAIISSSARGVRGVSAGNERFGWLAARVYACTANQMALNDGDLHSCIVQSAR